MRRREHVEPIRCDKRCGVSAGTGHGLHAGAATTGGDGLDQARPANNNMDDPGCRIEECDVRRAGDRLLVAALT